MYICISVCMFMYINIGQPMGVILYYYDLWKAGQQVQ